MMKARDSQRLQDMDTVHKAIGLALADNEITLVDTSAIASCCDSLQNTQAVDGANGWVRFTINTGKQGLVKYLATLPVDPTNTGTLVYTYASDGNNYELNTELESTDNDTKMQTDGGNSDTVFEVGTSLTIL
jgi:hypothetical protein